MRGKNLFGIALIITICTPIVFVGLILAQPKPIGQTVQDNPFESNPTTHDFQGDFMASDLPSAYDGSLTTTALFYYGYAGYFNLFGFDNAPPELFTISWVDLKVSYEAQGIFFSDDLYRILCYVDPYPDPIVLQDWVTGVDAIYPLDAPPGPGHRAWGNVTEPNDGVWDWTDVGNVHVVIETDPGPNMFEDFVYMYVYEVWLTIYSGPLPPPGVSVQPSPVLDVPAGEIFFVDVYIRNVTKLWGYQFVLYFDNTTILARKYYSYGPFNSPGPSVIGPDYVAMAYASYSGDLEGLTGSGPLARIYFEVLADEMSMLDLEGVVLSGIGIPIEVDVTDGLFANVEVRDVAVTQVEVSPTQVMPGENVTIDVTVMNKGTRLETFDVTVLYNDTIPIAPTSTKTVIDLIPWIREDLSFIWNTTGITVGHYSVTAVASPVPDETDTTNNVKVWDLVPEGVLLGRHDIAVTSVVRAYSDGTIVSDGETLTVGRGETAIINATVANLGNFTETFNVTAVWRVMRSIENKTDVSLDAGNSITLTFEWNTDVTHPPWEFGHETVWPFDPLNSSHGNIAVYAAPGWSAGTLFAKGVPHEKLELDPPYEALGYDYTDDNVFTDGVVNVTRDLRLPIAKFTVDNTEKFVGEPVKFQGDTSQTPIGTTIDKYRWDFGDGNVTEVNYPTIWHAYTSPGRYSVNLTVTSSIGLNDSIKTGMTGAPPGEIEVDWRNLKIVGVDASPTSVLVGQNVTISVTIQNEGGRNEVKLVTLKTNVTVYYDDVTIGKIPVPNLGSWDQPDNQSTIELNWTTSDMSPGIYTIKVMLDVLPYENNTDDNIMLFDGEVTLLWHDIAVSDVSASPTEVKAGESVTVTVTVENQGDFAETFTVTAYANETQIGDPQTVTDLAIDASTSLTFTWDTTDVDPGTYTMEAVASTVSGEFDTADNVLSGDAVTVKGETGVPTSILLYAVAGVAIAIAAAIVLFYFLKLRKP